MNGNKYLLPLLACGVLAMTACGTADKDWANASIQNSVTGYQMFLDKHAGDQRAQEARTRIATLQDDSAWKTAQDGNSVDGYKQYIQERPDGTYVQAARDRITGLERANAWKVAQTDGSATSLQAFLQKYPQGTEADQAKQKLAALHADYRAELGVFHDEHAADHKKSELQSRFSGVLKEVDVLSPDTSNKRFRVMSGLMDRHDADSVCTSLKHDHQTCEVIKTNQGQS